MADAHQEALDARVRALRDAADQLEAVRGQAPQQVEQPIVEAQSCFLQTNVHELSLTPIA